LRGIIAIKSEAIEKDIIEKT